MNRILLLIILLFATFVRPAQAFLDPPYITPESPMVGEMITVNIYGGECDRADTGPVWPPPVTQDGNNITILLTGTHHGSDWCCFTIGTETFPVGAYTVGSYTLDVERRYFNFAGVLVQETLGIIPFTVVGEALTPEPVAAPSMGVGGLGTLLFALVSIALWRLRQADASEGSWRSTRRDSG